MTIAYLDTSAAMKFLVEEAESAALVARLSTDPTCRLVASWLLHTELHCAAARNPALIPLRSVTKVLSTVTLVDITRGDLLSAGTLTPLKSADAIHLAAALRLGVDQMITYDVELAAAAQAAGLEVLAPK